MLIMMNGDVMVNFTKNGIYDEFLQRLGPGWQINVAHLGVHLAKIHGQPHVWSAGFSCFFKISSISPWCLVKSTGFFKSLALSEHR
jgi:hypothetical protein